MIADFDIGRANYDPFDEMTVLVDEVRRLRRERGSIQAEMADYWLLVAKWQDASLNSDEFLEALIALRSGQPLYYGDKK